MNVNAGLILARTAPPGRVHYPEPHTQGFTLGYYPRLPLGGAPKLACSKEFASSDSEVQNSHAITLTAPAL
jgi:hypothetical protein